MRQKKLGICARSQFRQQTCLFSNLLDKQLCWWWLEWTVLGVQLIGKDCVQKSSNISHTFGFFHSNKGKLQKKFSLNFSNFCDVRKWKEIKQRWKSYFHNGFWTSELLQCDAEGKLRLKQRAKRKKERFHKILHTAGDSNHGDEFFFGQQPEFGHFAGEFSPNSLHNFMQPKRKKHFWKSQN